MPFTSWRRSLKSSSRTTRSRRRCAGLIKWTGLACEVLEDRTMLSGFTVLNTNDSGAGSLRQAMLDANASAGADTICFNIEVGDLNFVDVDSALAGGDAAADAFLIKPLTALPALNDPTGGTTIDGRTQTVFGGDTNPFGPEIVLDGTMADPSVFVDGVLIQSDGNRVFDVNIQNFSGNGIFINGGDNNLLTGNFIGTDASGTVRLGNLHGVNLRNGASSNRIENNLISGNAAQGITMKGAGTSDNKIFGNKIGTDSTAAFSVDNGSNGIFVLGGASHNFIGTDSDGLNDDSEGNLISGNSKSGIRISEQGTSNITVAGNFIGTDITGSVGLANALGGIIIDLGATENRIGTNHDGFTDLAERNVISGNDQYGVILGDLGTMHNTVSGNYIGTDAMGTTGLGNSFSGVGVVGGPSLNRIERNVISGNTLHGIQLFGTGTSNNKILGNLIGTDGSGAFAVANGVHGIEITTGASSNFIGTDGNGDNDANEGNVISGNAMRGVRIHGPGTDNNIVAGNYIGTDVNGTNQIPNQRDGVMILAGASANIIGTDGDGVADAAERNIISGNAFRGIRIQNAGTIQNIVAGNYIGTDVSGSANLGNGLDGVWIRTGASDNRIGTNGDSVADAAEANTIAFNSGRGVWVLSSTSTGNRIRANSIHSNGALGIDLDAAGVTANDAGDIDGGPNSVQNFPVVTQSIAGATTRIVGSLNSLPSMTFIVDFYANDVADASGNGEGQRHLGFANVTTDASGNADFDVTLSVATSVGEVVAATATDPLGNTSEFSNAEVEVDANVAPVAHPNGPYMVDEGGSVQLDASGSSDPNQPTSTLTFEWDLDGDGFFGETGVGALRGDEVGITPTFSAAGLDGPNMLTVALRVTDDGGLTDTNAAIIDIENVAPQLAAANATVTVNEGQTAANSGTFSDPGIDIVSITSSVGTVVQVGTESGTWSWSFDTADGPGDSQSVVITATDSDGGFTFISFALVVSNVAPIADDATFEVVENSSNGMSVGGVTASDPGDDTLTYSITGGASSTAFAINAATGQITVADSTQLDFETTPSFTIEVTVTDDDGATNIANVTINLLNQASILGTVYVDADLDGQFDANEMGIDGVMIELLDANGQSILDELNNPVTAVTGDGGFYLFEDLDPGTYQVRELQPTGIDDGTEQLGSLGGSIVANDTMQLTLARTDAFDYVFAELGQAVSSGDTAGIGFWQNKNGQALINAGGVSLANWLSGTFENVFGNVFDSMSVADFYKQELFKQKSTKSSGPAKVDAQFMATALATYFTSSNLAGTVAADFGFNVSETGIGTKVINVGTSGAAFNEADGTNLTIMQLLLATNALTDQPDSLTGAAKTYDTNGDGVIDATEAALRTKASLLYAFINEA